MSEIEHLKQRIASLESLFSAARVAPQHHGTPIGLPIPFFHVTGTVTPSTGKIVFTFQDTTGINTAGSMHACGISYESSPSNVLQGSKFSAWRGGFFLCLLSAEGLALPSGPTTTPPAPPQVRDDRFVRTHIEVINQSGGLVSVFAKPAKQDRFNVAGRWAGGVVSPVHDDWRGTQYHNHVAVVGIGPGDTLECKMEFQSPELWPTQAAGAVSFTMIRLGPFHDNAATPNFFAQYHSSGSGPGTGGGGGGV